MDWKLHKDIFIAFFRSGMLGYGGGPSTIPLVHKEVVEHFKWMTDEEFADVLALANTLPGPINTKMSGYIGYRVGGWSGLLNGVLATVMPTVILMIGLIGILSTFRDSRVVAGMTQAVAPVVGVMLFSLAYGFMKQSKKGIGWLQTVILAIVSLVAYQFLMIHPAIIIGILLLYGMLSRNPKKLKKRST
ncbi:chromate transporter [Halalkalibacterium ligniniphilum]|uniref:chromate transporter n=1 Tax=Halalkalibacterium ligniniphilum TaxID=1134413 RepID=UPI000346A42D|nr:chromate transporter [Halalkalibacterium ligniniphilum]